MPGISATLATEDIGKQGWAFNGERWEKVRIVDVILRRSYFVMMRGGYSEWNSYKVDNGIDRYWTGLLHFVWERPGWIKELDTTVGSNTAHGLSSEERKRLVMNRIGVEPVHIDTLQELTGLTAYEVSYALVCLELQGRVRQSVGKLFMVTQKRVTDDFCGSVEFNNS